MKNKGKKFNVKFECANEEVLRDSLINNKTKILHISGHGQFDGKYSLLLENLKKNGEVLELGIDTLKNILNKNKRNISQLDLVFVSTCFSEDFRDLFAECGAKNIIYICRETEVIDRISIIFTEYFYKKLIDGYSIHQSFDTAIKLTQRNPVAKYLNYRGCCCHHYHKEKCLLKYIKLHSIHHKKLENCKCQESSPNYHKKECKYYEEYYRKIVK